MERYKNSLKYDVDSLAETFGIHADEKSEILNTWLSSKENLSKNILELVEILRNKLVKSGNNWNEEELKVQFIGIILFLADIEEDKKIKTFFERSLSATVKGIHLSVIADCLVATPKGLGGSPRSPYFFLQEYKKSKGDKQDPESQMLTAMLIAQELNQNDAPIFGCWVVGANWHFTVLHHKAYSVSRQFDATQHDDLTQIIISLRKIRDYVLADKLSS